MSEIILILAVIAISAIAFTATRNRKKPLKGYTNPNYQSDPIITETPKSSGTSSITGIGKQTKKTSPKRSTKGEGNSKPSVKTKKKTTKKKAD